MIHDTLTTSRCLSVLDELETAIEQESADMAELGYWKHVAEKWRRRANDYEQRLFGATRHYNFEIELLKDELQEWQIYSENAVALADKLLNCAHGHGPSPDTELGRLKLQLEETKRITILAKTKSHINNTTY